MKDKLLAIWKKLYSYTAFYRLFWTGISVAAGAAAVQFGADPQWGFMVVLVTTAITTVARQNLGDANFGAEADAKVVKQKRKAE